MPIIENANIRYLRANPARGSHYKNDKSNPELWSVQVSTKDKKEKDVWANDYGMKVTPVETDDGIEYKGSISAYTRSSNGELNQPVTVITATGEALDPDTVGNDSTANVRFRLTGNKADGLRRRLTGVQVLKLVKYESPDEDFLIQDNMEIIETGDNDEPENSDY